MDDDIKQVVKMEIDEKPTPEDAQEDDVKPTLLKVKEDIASGKTPTAAPGKVLFASKFKRIKPRFEDGEWPDTSSHDGDHADSEERKYYTTPTPDDYGGYEDDYEDYWPHRPLKPEILNKLEVALRDGPGIAHTFAHHRTHLDAPNPVIRIEGLGHIGLPISDLAIPPLLRHCSQVKPEHDTKTLDLPLRFDSSKVHFENSAWTTFLENAIENACLGLGAPEIGKVKSHRPIGILSSVLLYKPGSSGFMDASSTLPRSFGSLIVVLPTTCPSRLVTVSHDQRSITIQPAANPARSTLILSTYHDVSVTEEECRSGYELVLSFALVDMRERQAPSFAKLHLRYDALQEALSLWRDALPEMTTKVLYKLNHKYPWDDLTLRSLKGEDFRRVSLLSSVAARHGFHVGLAFVETFIIGTAHSEDIRNPEGWWYVENEEAPDLELDSDNRVFEKTRICNLADLQGTPVAKTLFFNEKEVIFFKGKSMGAFRRKDPDATEYCAYEQRLSRWYRQAVVAIWPSGCEVEFRYGTSYLQQASSALEELTSEQPSEEELQYANYMLHLDGSVLHSKDAEEGLYKCIFRWKDLEMWRRAIKLCPAQYLAHYCCTAFSHFGPAILPDIRTLVDGLDGNSKRLNFLDKAAIKLSEDPEASIDWVLEERNRVLRSLLPIQSEHWGGSKEFPLLVQGAESLGGITYFRDVILPQVRESLTTAHLVAMVNLVHGNRSLIHTPGDAATVQSVIRDLKSQLVLSPTPESIPSIMDLVKLSCDPEKDSSWREDLVRLVAPPTANTDQGIAFLRELLTSLKALVSTRSFDKSNPPFRPFFKRFVKTYVDTFLGPGFSQAERELIAGLTGLPCDCDWCRSIVGFLETPTQNTLVLQKISKNQIKHAQKQLSDQNGEKLLSWEPVSGLPQFKIVKLEDSLKLIHWPTYRQRVITFLVALTDNEDTLKDIMGDAEYRTLLRNLDVKTVHPQPEPEENSQEERPLKRRRIRTQAKDVIDLVSP